MNRNEMYEYLKGIGMYSMAIRHNNKYKSYHIEFRPNVDLNQDNFSIFTDWGWINGCGSIHLRLTGVRIEMKISGEIYINYKDINKFEVVFEE